MERRVRSEGRRKRARRSRRGSSDGRDVVEDTVEEARRRESRAGVVIDVSAVARKSARRKLLGGGEAIGSVDGEAGRGSSDGAEAEGGVSAVARKSARRKLLGGGEAIGSVDGEAGRGSSDGGEAEGGMPALERAVHGDVRAEYDPRPSSNFAYSGFRTERQDEQE